jgi:hypothetical protein
MLRAPSKARRARQLALFAVGALAVHQLRYALALGAGGHEAGLAHRHGYLELLAPAAVGATLAAICVSLLAAALRRRLPAGARPSGPTERAAAFAAGLLAVHFLQEFAESVVVSGQPGAVESIFGAGGWLVVPLAMLFGAAAALVGGLLDRAEVRLASRPPVRTPRAPRRLRRPTAVAPRCLASLTLGFGFARRPPPLPTAG